MAERRMFAKSVVQSDRFIDLSITARLLYYDLGMEADDDGFVDTVKRTMIIDGTTEEDLRELIDKRFIIRFPSGVYAIRDWHVINRIQKDRYKETMYIEEKSMLSIDDNKRYIPCIQNVSKVEPQDSIV